MNSLIRYYVAQIIMTVFLIMLGIQCVFLLLTGNSNIHLSLIVLISFLIFLVVRQFITRKPLREEIQQKLISQKTYYYLQLFNIYLSRLIITVGVLTLIYLVFIQKNSLEVI